MDDGGTPLSHFVIERQEQGAGLEWDEIGETAADITKFECLEFENSGLIVFTQTVMIRL